MAKRKSRARKFVANKKRVGDINSTVFSCPFGCYGKSVECEVDMKEMDGRAVCSSCLRCFTMKITASARPIDICREWCDDCKRDVTYDSDFSSVNSS